MKKTSQKLFTTALVSAVAVSPLAAVGTTNTAHAESLDATGIATAFNDLSAQEQEIANIVLKNVREDIDAFIEPTYTGEQRTRLITAFGNVLADIPTGLSDNDLAAIIQGRYNTFIDAIRADLGANGTADELAAYINDIATDLIMESGNVDPSNLNAFVDRLKAVVTEENPMPQGVNDVMTFGDTETLARVLSEIQYEVDLVVNPEEPVEDNGDGELVTDDSALQDQTERVIENIQATEELETFVVEAGPDTTEVAIPYSIVDAIDEKNSTAVIGVQTDLGSYQLEVSSVDYVGLAAAMGITLSELQIVVQITPADSTPNTLLGRDVLVDAVTFEVFASNTASVDSESVEITEFFAPLGRSVTSDVPLFDPLTTVAVRINGDGTVTPKPTFVENVVGGEGTEVVFYSNTNSTYTVIENFQTFDDVDGGRTVAEPYIEKLASRLIVKGVSADMFMPAKNITRGEFAALLARGLGIEPIEAGDGTFPDVNSTMAVNRNGEIYAAVDAGIISGYTDGTFRPSATITREQAAIMISKAMQYVGDHKITFDGDKNISAFTDYTKIGAAAQPHVERVYEAGYINGFLDQSYRPKTATNRGQMTIILYKFLNSVQFIN